MRKQPYGRSMTLRKYREAQGLTLADLAAMVGCSTAALSRIERGERKPKYALTQAIVAVSGGKVKAKDLHPK
jgi:transcriptional regulator with XRE-family HTH domain